MKAVDIALIFGFLLGLVLIALLRLFRYAWAQRKTKHLIHELEGFLGHPLPRFKKDKKHTQIHWVRVLTLLKKEPTTDKVTHFQKLVTQQLPKPPRSKTKR